MHVLSPNGATPSAQAAPSLVDVRCAVRAHEDPVALAAALAWAAGLAHALAVGEHAAHWPLAAVFFGVLAVAQFAWGAFVYRDPSRVLLRVGIAGSLALVALWAVSRTVGLPFGPDAGTPEEIGTLDVMATVAELLCAGLAAALLHPRTAARIPGTAVYLMLIATVTAMILSGGHHHGG